MDFFGGYCFLNNAALAAQHLSDSGVARVAVLAAIQRFGAEALVVSLGMDTFAGDPISGFTLQSADYLRVGERLFATGLPTALVFEGGYAVAEVGVNAANVLEAFG